MGRILEEYNMKIKKEEKGNFVEDKLPEITLDCLKKIKSTFVVLNNSFFTISDKNLVVLKCFISKNSDINITKFLPLIGSSLKEESYGKTSILYASIKNATVKISNKLKNKKGIITVDSIATPIKYKNQIIGYISLTTMNTELLKILHIFMESLCLNIERELEKAFIKEELIKYLRLINIESKAQLENYLSDKETLVTKYLLMAYSNIEIADTLSISESTVKTYLRRIYEKLGTSNRIDTAIAIICGNILEKL